VHARPSNNLSAVLAEIEAASLSRGCARPPRLIAVTKSVTPEVAHGLYLAGQRDFGENRLAELEAKRAWFDAQGAGEATWHFLGHLQRNKARRVLRLAQVIHSVDSLALIETLERIAAEEGLRPAVFLELALTGEANKTGFAPRELPTALAALFQASHLEPRGLMAMAPLEGDSGALRAAAAGTFAELARLAAGNADRPWARGRAELSMGMSSDWREALAAGSDWLRIGTALFSGQAPDPLGSAPGGRP
jgi:pyridoxal phosphate enzyme (YggS family)